MGAANLWRPFRRCDDDDAGGGLIERNMRGKVAARRHHHQWRRLGGAGTGNAVCRDLRGVVARHC